MGTLVAVETMTLIPSDSNVVCTIALTGVPSLKSKAEGNAICTDGIEVTVTAITVPSAGATIPDAGPYIVPLNSTTTIVNADGNLVLLEGDESDTINATPQIPGSPSTPYPVSFTVQISVAGQLTVKAV